VSTPRCNLGLFPNQSYGSRFLFRQNGREPESPLEVHPAMSDCLFPPRYCRVELCCEASSIPRMDPHILYKARTRTSGSMETLLLAWREAERAMEIPIRPTPNHSSSRLHFHRPPRACTVRYVCSDPRLRRKQLHFRILAFHSRPLCALFFRRCSQDFSAAIRIVCIDSLS